MNKEIERIKSQIKDLQSKLAVMEATCAALPEDFPESNSAAVFDRTGGPSELHLRYSATTIQGALDLLATIWNFQGVDVLPLSLCKDDMNYTSFLTPYHGRTGKITNVFPVVVNVSAYDVAFQMFVLGQNDQVIKIIVNLHPDRDIAHVAFAKGTKYVHNCHLSAPAFNNYDVITWASGGREYPNSYTMYWTDAKDLEGMLAEAK